MPAPNESKMVVQEGAPHQVGQARPQKLLVTPPLTKSSTSTRRATWALMKAWGQIANITHYWSMTDLQYFHKRSLHFSPLPPFGLKTTSSWPSPNAAALARSRHNLIQSDPMQNCQCGCFRRRRSNATVLAPRFEFWRSKGGKAAEHGSESKASQGWDQYWSRHPNPRWPKEVTKISCCRNPEVAWFDFQGLENLRFCKSGRLSALHTLVLGPPHETAAHFGLCQISAIHQIDVSQADNANICNLHPDQMNLPQGPGSARVQNHQLLRVRSKVSMP